MKHPNEEEFIAWREHPVTQWVMAACRLAAGDAERLWQARSWEAGECDPDLLLELRTRADSYLGLPDTSHEDWTAIHDQPR